MSGPNEKLDYFLERRGKFVAVHVCGKLLSVASMSCIRSESCGIAFPSKQFSIQFYNFQVVYYC